VERQRCDERRSACQDRHDHRRAQHADGKRHGRSADDGVDDGDRQQWLTECLEALAQHPRICDREHAVDGDDPVFGLDQVGVYERPSAEAVCL
jgi:hypothetical protein